MSTGNEEEWQVGTALGTKSDKFIRKWYDVFRGMSKYLERVKFTYEEDSTDWL